MSSVSYFLEEFDLTSDDGEDTALNLPGLANDGYPGLVGSFEYDETISAPIVSNGKVRLPVGGSAQRANFRGDIMVASNPGGFVAATFSPSHQYIEAVNGLLYFPLAQAAASAPGCTVSSVPGAIAGAEVDAACTAPYINNGVLYFPRAGTGDLQGLQDITGASLTWEQIKGSAGSQVLVASTQLRTGSNSYIPISLSVGCNADGFLTFSLSNS